MSTDTATTSRLHLGPFSRWPEARRGQLTLIVLTLLSAAPFFLHMHEVVPDGPLGLNLDPMQLAKTVRWAWDGSQELGKRTSWGVTNIPLATLFAGLRKVGLSPALIQQLWFSALLAASSLGLARLFRLVWHDSNWSSAALAGFLYAFNPYVLFNLKGGSVLLLPYAIAPWLTIRFIRLVREPSWILVFGAVGVSLLAPGINPVVNAVAAVGCALVVAGELARHRDRLRPAVIAAGTAGLCLVVNLWWIGPFVASLRAGGTDSTFLTDPISIGALGSSFLEVFRLSGLWALYGGHKGQPYLPSQSYFLSTSVIVLSLLLPVAVLVGMARRWRDPMAKALGLLIVLAVPLAVSVHPPGRPTPTGRVYQWIYDNVFVFRAFRSNYKWVGLLSFTYALVAPLLLLRRRAAPRRGEPLLVGMGGVAVVLVAALFAVPFVAGRIQPANATIGEIPGYWRAAARWLDTRPESAGRTLFLPAQPFSVYTWGKPLGDIAETLVDGSVLTPSLVTSTTPQGQALVAMAGRAPRDLSVPFAKVLDLLHVSYVIQRNDVDTTYYDSPSPAEMKDFLSRQPTLEFVRTFGKLDVYRNREAISSRLGVAAGIDEIFTDGDLSSAVEYHQPGALARFGQATRRTPQVTTARASSVWNRLDEQFGPLAALDGDDTTAWVGGDGRPVGEWVEYEFSRPLPVRTVEVIVRDNGVDARPVRLRVAAGTTSRTVSVKQDGTAAARFDGTEIRRLRITIGEVGPGGPNAGLAEIQIPGVTRSVLRYPDHRVGAPPVYVMNFERSGLRNLDRQITLGSTASYRVEGVATVAPTLSEPEVASLFDLRGATRLSASSRWYDLAAYGPYALFDHDLQSAWVGQTAGGIGEWIEVELDRRRPVPSVDVHARLNGSDPEVAAVEVIADGMSLGRRPVSIRHDGWATIPVGINVRTLRLVIRATGTEGQTQNVGFTELRMPGVEILRKPELLKEITIFADTSPVTVALHPEQATNALGTGRYRFSAPLVLAAGQHELRRDSKTVRFEQLTLIPRNRSEVSQIRWLPSRRHNPVLLTARVPEGAGRYLFFAETGDPLWVATQNGRPLISTGIGNGYGGVWELRGGGQVSLRFDDRSDVELWAVVSALSILMLSGTVLSRFWHRRERQR